MNAILQALLAVAVAAPPIANPASAAMSPLTKPAATTAAVPSAAKASAPATSPTKATSLPSFPDEQFRNERPKPGAEPKLVLPKIQRFTVSPLGLDSYLVEDHVLPTVSLTLQWDVGGVDDARGKEGTASMCMALLQEGTVKRTKIAFEERKADLAVSLGASGSTESSALNLNTLKAQLGESLDLFAEVLREPGLRKEDLDRLRAREKASVQQAKAAPASIGGRLFSSIIVGAAHPYGHVVTETSLDAITIDDCKAYVAKLKPNGARLFAVGDVTSDELTKALAGRLTGWTGKAPSKPRIAKAKGEKGTLFFVDVPGAPQSQIYVGLEGPPRGSRDYEATLLMNEILGGGFGSRINMNLREKHGYAYGARSGFGYRRAFSTFAASSSVRTDATGPSLREISTELTNIRTGPPTDVELTRERTGAELQLPASFSTGSRILDTFSDLVFFGLPLDTYEGFRARLEAVDAAAIQRAASAHVRDKGVKVLVVGDGKVVRDDLEKIAREKLFGDEGFVELDADGKVIPAGKAAAAKAKGTVTGEPASQGSAKP